MIDDKLDTCGCCEGERRLTPAAIYNPPGLDALTYRAGTHAAFFETMIADLARQEILVKSADGKEVENRLRPLAGLKTRCRDDFAIALLDAWATIADVLTFYQERIANEGYLATATERRSILELARLVGYELAPGVAASTFLSFTVDETKGAALIPKGTRAQSIPEPGEKMQSFETMRDLEARYEYNEIRLRTAQPQFLTESALPGVLYLPGQRNDLRLPDRILLAFGKNGLSGTFDLSAQNKDVAYYLTRLKSASLVTEPARTRVEIELEGKIGNSNNGLATPPLAPTIDYTKEVAAIKPAPWFLPQSWINVISAMSKGGMVSPPPPETVVADARGQGAGLGGLVVLDPTFAGNIYDVMGQEVALLPKNTPALRAVVLFRLQAHLHGHNAPWRGYSVETIESRRRTFEPKWEDWWSWSDAEDKLYKSAWVELFKPKDNSSTVVTLDNVYEQIGVGGYAVLAWAQEGEQKLALFQVTGTDLVSTSLFNVPATATRLKLTKVVGADLQPDTMAIIRSTTVYAASEFVSNPVPPRILDLEPVPDITVGKELELDGIYKGLQPGRWITLSGMRADIPVVGQEVALVQAVEHRFAQTNKYGNLPGDLRHTFLTLTKDPSLSYRRGTLRLSANVVTATHGETARGVPPRDQDVILGSGNGGEAHQRFPLKLQPGQRLTYLSAPTASGVESTLQVYVGDVLWQPRRTLLDAGPGEHVYTVRTDDDGQTTVIFGDGHEGARPPTGRENVWARYRIGIGKPGNVRAGQISLLATRPPGVKEVKNWVAATGGADPEDRDQARQSVPFAARTLDRLVGQQDYEDFARTFAGIGKAWAEYDKNEGKVIVHVAGRDNAPLEGSQVKANLEKALNEHDGSNVGIEVKVFTPRLISLDATVTIAPDRLWEKVQPAVRAALEARFAFGRRELGQDVALGEVVQAIQEVPGVTHVQVTRLAALTKEDLEKQADGDAGNGSVKVGCILQVAAGTDDGNVKCELAFIDPAVPSLIVLRQLDKEEGGQQ